MNTYTIEQAKGMVGQVIPRIEAKLTKIYDRETKEGEYGPYSFQNGEVSDATGSMKVSFGNQPDMSNKVNQVIVLKSMQTKHGLKGVEVKANEYKGKTTIELKLTKTALVVGSGEEPNVDFAPHSTREQAPEQPLANNSASAKPAKPVKPTDTRLDMALVRNRMTQLAGLYDLCFKSAQDLEALNVLEQGDLKDVASCLFIQSMREGLADKMPIRTLDKKEENENEACDISDKSEEEPF